MRYISNTYWSSHYRAWILNMSLKYTLCNAFCFLISLFSFKCTLGFEPKDPYIGGKCSPLLRVTSVEAGKMAQQLRTRVTLPQDSSSVSNSHIRQLTDTGALSPGHLSPFLILGSDHTHITHRLIDTQTKNTYQSY